MIQIDKERLTQIRRHAETAYPEECCGALLGCLEHDIKCVTDVRPVVNRCDKETAQRRFLITSEDYMSLEKSAQNNGFEILGFYHSHADFSTLPSEFDKKGALPRLAYLIVAVKTGITRDISCWVLSDDRSSFVGEKVNILG